MPRKITKHSEEKKSQTNYELPLSNEKPDATVKTEKKGVIRGKREQISLTMPPEKLSMVDEVAKAQGLTRAGLINLSIFEYLRRYEAQR